MTMFVPEEELNCLICQELPRDAVETLCCHVLACAECMKAELKTRKRCPHCQNETFQTQPAVQVRRLIDRFQIRCEFCGSVLARTAIEEHRNGCKAVSDRELRACGAPDCKFSAGFQYSEFRHLEAGHG